MNLSHPIQPWIYYLRMIPLLIETYVYVSLGSKGLKYWTCTHYYTMEVFKNQSENNISNISNIQTSQEMNLTFVLILYATRSHH